MAAEGARAELHVGHELQVHEERPLLRLREPRSTSMNDRSTSMKTRSIGWGGDDHLVRVAGEMQLGLLLLHEDSSMMRLAIRTQPRELVLEPVAKEVHVPILEPKRTRPLLLLSCCTSLTWILPIAFASTLLIGGGACMTEKARVVNLTTPWMLAKSG